uniref:U6 small nuclear RNA (adenine-(43)-N(6))-methyltransferase n=1 Tax=Syphacia muris TaxID=451379 RepID=A0A0N5ABN3_9BILA
MACKKGMHPRNPYRDKPPDFSSLARKHAEFRSHCYVAPNGKLLLNFRSSDAVRALTKILLQEDFGLNVELPSDCLVPRVPQRLNYVLFIDDLIKMNKLKDDIIGIDIGTGASCIYALLGAKNFKWHFVATETDALAVEVASKNVAQNSLEEYIDVVAVDKDRLIKDIVREHPSSQFTFCMCNPPFYEQEESEQKFSYIAGGVMSNSSSSSGVRSAPHSATIARTNELSVDGGEVAFVGRLIEDSVILQKSVMFYTSMIGKKSSLTELKKKLRRFPNVRFIVETLNQGKTQRWILTWTFHSNLKLSLLTKDFAPLEMPLPDQINNEDQILSWMKRILDEIDINYEEIENRRLHCEAIRNTWSQQRQRKRLLNIPSAPLCSTVSDGVMPAKKRIRLAKVDVGVNVAMGVGDGRDSFGEAGNFNHCFSEQFKLCAGKVNVSVQAYIPSIIDINSAVRFCVDWSEDCNILILKWIDGSRQALHQISQYVRNQLQKMEKMPLSLCFARD